MAIGLIGVKDSKARLEDLFDVRVDFFCFPGGIYDRRVKLAVRRAGYLAATGTRYGAATPRDLFSLARIYAYKGESMASFGSRLEETLPPPNERGRRVSAGVGWRRR